MKRLLGLGLGFLSCLFGQNPQVLNNVNQINWTSPNYAPVTGVTAQVSGTNPVPGLARYYYWIVAKTSVGNVSPSNSAFISNAPNTLSGTNYVLVSWKPVPYATGYDVLRTTTPYLPPSGNIALALNVTPVTTTYADLGTSLVSYTINTYNPSNFSQIGPQVKSCVGSPGNTPGYYLQQCQDSGGGFYVCNNLAGCLVIADWVNVSGSGGPPSGVATNALKGNYPGPLLNVGTNAVLGSNGGSLPIDISGAVLQNSSAVSILRDFPSVLDYSSLITAISIIGSTPTTLQISSAITLSGVLTIPKNVTLNFGENGSINCNGNNISYNGQIQGDQHAIFVNCPKFAVSFISNTGVQSYLKDRWWGATYNGSTDDTTALEAIYTAASNKGGTYHLGVLTASGTSLMCNMHAQDTSDPGCPTTAQCAAPAYIKPEAGVSWTSNTTIWKRTSTCSSPNYVTIQNTASSVGFQGITWDCGGNGTLGVGANCLDTSWLMVANGPAVLRHDYDLNFNNIPDASTYGSAYGWKNDKCGSCTPEHINFRAFPGSTPSGNTITYENIVTGDLAKISDFHNFSQGNIVLDSQTDVLDNSTGYGLRIGQTAQGTGNNNVVIHGGQWEANPATGYVIYCDAPPPLTGVGANYGCTGIHSDGTFYSPSGLASGQHVFGGAILGTSDIINGSFGINNGDWASSITTPLSTNPMFKIIGGHCTSGTTPASTSSYYIELHDVDCGGIINYPNIFISAFTIPGFLKLYSGGYDGTLSTPTIRATSNSNGSVVISGIGTGGVFLAYDNASGGTMFGSGTRTVVGRVNTSGNATFGSASDLASSTYRSYSNGIDASLQRALQTSVVASACAGIATLSSGTVTISTTCPIGSTDLIQLTRRSINSSTVLGTLGIGTITSGTSFVINSYTATATLATDNSIISWEIVKSF